MSDADLQLATSRLIDAPRDEVLAAFRDPVRLARWWGPDGFRNTFEEFDFRPGGRWRFVMHGPDGGDYRNESVFTAAGPETVVVDHQSPPRFRLTIALDEEAPGRTRVGWMQRFPTREERDRIAKFAVAANEQNLDRLAAEVARRDS